MTSPTAAEQMLEDAAGQAARLDRDAQIRLIQRIVSGLAAPPPSLDSLLQSARQLRPADQALLAQQLLLDLAALPAQQLDATLAVEARRRGAADAG